MAFSLPNPTSPTNGQSLDATPILANEVAIAQAIASFDGSQIQAGTVTGSALSTTANPNTLLAATTFPFVQNGCVWSIVTTLTGTMSGGTIYYNGTPVTVNSVANHTFTASKDTYIDIDKNGNITYQAVTNNTASPSLTANSIRVAIVVTGASAITFINSGQTDTSLSGFAPVVSGTAVTLADTIGNLIFPTDPTSRTVGYAQIITTFTGTATSLSVITGLTAAVITPSGRRLKASFTAGAIHSTISAGSLIELDVYDVTNSVEVAGLSISVPTSGYFMNPTFISRPFTPVSQSAIYEVRYGQNASGTVTIEISGSNPTFLELELA